MIAKEKIAEEVFGIPIAGDEEVQLWSKQLKNVQSIERIPGDASTRRYYRVATASDSYILMMAEPFSDQAEKYPFIEVQKHLHQTGVRVPELLGYDSEKGLILLEDLGDVTFLHRLKTVADVQTEKLLYEKVIDALVELHVNASPKTNSAQLAGFKLSFDFEKLMWEVNFTIEHFYKTHLNRKFNSGDEEVLVKGFTKICKILADEPRVFTHRDFHSRNVMVHKNEFVMIDFQDARMGPPQYDLASLLKDSYYQLSETQSHDLIEYYMDRFDLKKGGTPLDREHFRYIFDLMSIQRNFKAIGSFASFLNRRGNPTYLKYIGNTFENVRKTLLRHPEFSNLREVLFHYYYF